MDGRKGSRLFKLFKVETERFSDEAEEGYVGNGIPIGDSVGRGQKDSTSTKTGKNILETTH